MKQRELKFRAWHIENQEMLFEGWNREIYFNKGSLWAFGDSVEIMQFTGRRDDSEVEIYDGDIVEDILGRKYAVEWNDDILRWQLSDGSPLNDGDRYGVYLLVLGNIYENPSLLTPQTPNP